MVKFEVSEGKLSSVTKPYDSIKHNTLKPDFLLVAYRLKRLVIIKLNRQCETKVRNMKRNNEI